ncbi:MAG: protein-L-isoaspartate O-methyltransferase [Pseudomonadota bacterium]|jgi:protein-L-isoaspartate(D-aspartate) O-methyltransferase
MSDQPSGAKPKRFPLTLDAVTDKATRSRATVAPRFNSTQTAVKNVAVRAPVLVKSSPPSVVNTTTEKPIANVVRTVKRDENMTLVSEAIRKAMVKRVQQQGVQDPLVLAAMEAVPRHYFLEPGLASQAYIDASLPIGYHQTISQPYIVARMIEILREQTTGKLNRVLEIGTGCGYQAAVLAHVAKDVYSIERIKPLHELARNNLRQLRIPNLRLHYGDGMLGFPQVAPFDGIILAAAGLEVPQALLDQMAVGGRLIAPIGEKNQVLKLVLRTGVFEWKTETLETCHFVPLKAGTLG